MKDIRQQQKAERQSAFEARQCQGVSRKPIGVARTNRRAGDLVTGGKQGGRAVLNRRRILGNWNQLARP
jgi:hypothetical protein